MARTGVRIPITSDASGVSSGVRDAERALDRLNKSGSRTFGALKIGAAGAAVAFGGGLAMALRTGINEMMEAEKISAQTAATLKSTGNAAGVTQKQVEGLASKLQALTGVEDDQIQSAQNLLLTFTKISGDTFPRATKAALDLSVAFGKDMNASAVMLGKALQDPIKGVSALSRVGVTFTAQQKEQIKAMVEAGKTADAQKLILRELETQVGGSGRAFGQSLPGQLQRAQRAWEDITQKLAVEFIPVMTKVAEVVLRNMPKIEAAISRIAGVVRGTVQVVKAIIDQDWDRAWKLAAPAVDAALDGIKRALRGVGSWALSAAADAGRAIGRGLYNGIYAALQRLPGPVRRFLGLDGSRDTTNVTGGQGFDFTGGRPPAQVPRQARAVGGVVHGPQGAGDVVPAMLSPGEVVLNDRQQQILGVDRIREVLARTGGVMGGFRFAQGGWVNPAPGARRGGGPGGGTHSFSEAPNNWQSDMAYDLMGHDGMRVYATHSGRISATRPFSSDPRFWGAAVYLDAAGGQFYYKHLKTVAVNAGQRVEAGDLIGTLGVGVNGGPHLHLGATSRGLLDSAVNAPNRTGSAKRKGHHTPEREARNAPGSGPSFPGFGQRGAPIRGTTPNAYTIVGRSFVGADGRTYVTDQPIINGGAPGLVVDPSTGVDPASLVMPPDQADLIRARTNMLMTEWGMTSRGSGDIGTGGSTAISAAFPGGRTVNITVGASSLVSAVASAAGGQGYSTPAAVPAGV